MSTTPTPPQQGECSEKARLLAKYKVAASDYGRVVMLLSERSGVMSKDDYTRIRDYSEIARATAEHERAALDRHVAEHGC